jgi:hypothetical protein
MSYLLLVVLSLGQLECGGAQAEADDPYRPGVFPPLSRPGSELPAATANAPPSPLPLERPVDPGSLDRPLAALVPLPWMTGTQEDRLPRKASSSAAGLWGTLTTNVAVNESEVAPPWEEPLWKRTWKTDQSWRCTLVGPVYAFGQMGANSEEASQSDMKVSGRTGLACKLPVGSIAEFQVRTGPGVSYTDPLHPDRTHEKSDWQVEVQVRCPLLLGIGLEYQGVALPALTPQAQDQITHDVRLAFPVGGAGKLQVGARHSWTNTTTNEPRPWTDNMQLYLGLELAR